MNHSYYFPDSRRSPYPRRRKSLAPRSPELSRSLPAITLLSPDTYHLQQTMTPRPLSPGAFRMIPPRSAKRKISSFVILNETIETPVASREATPSGRVSPFRGHGFKSPVSSRSQSRAVSPLPSPAKKRRAVVPTEKTKTIYKDIGLPPKSPKKILKNVKIQEHKPTSKPKPPIPAKPAMNTNNIAKAGNKKSMVMSTVDGKKDKKSPVPPKKPKAVNEKKQANVEAMKNNLESAEKPRDENDPVVVSEAVPAINESITEIKKKMDEEKTERPIPCYQPDKCCMVPPTMASPLQTVTSTITVPASTSSVTTASRAPASLTAVTAAVSVTDAFSKRNSPDQPPSPQPSDYHQPDPPSSATSQASIVPAAVQADIHRNNSAGSQKSHLKVITASSPTLSERTRSSMITVRAASSGSLKKDANSSGVSSAVMSTTRLVRADPDVEVLSPNNLLRSPPDMTMSQPLWVDERTPNGTAPAEVVPKGRCRRFFSALWRIISYIFCCCKSWRCWANCAKRCKCKSPCTRINCIECCKRRNQTEHSDSCCTRCRRRSCNPCTALTACFSKCKCCKKIECCKRSSCSCSSCCKKPKCCEGRKCCRKSHAPAEGSKTSCCAKPSCSCKDCCAKMKNCCRSCGDSINSCCRSFFCFNLNCCQKCLRKCSCCHKYKCCKKGGCCSCCNPNVKPEQKARLDKKNSRASNQSKQERAKLDSALVDHNSWMKAAIPVLPSCLAWLCLLFNIVIPGSGTILSGVLCLCFGKPRFSVNDNAQNRMSSFLVNILIGIGQAFTIIFCLVGWGWSIWWGVIIVKLARKQKRLRLADKNSEGGPSSTNHVDVERQ